MLPVMIPMGMADMAVEFMSRYPDFEVTLSEQGSNALMNRLKLDELDAAIVILTGQHESVKVIKIMEAGVMAVVPANHKLAGKSSITIEDLQDERLIIQTDSFNLQRLILNRMEEQGITYKPFFSCSQIDTCFVLVSKGLGISFCSESIINRSRYDNLAYVPMEGIESRKIYLAYAKSPEYHPALKTFIEFVINRYNITNP